MRTKKTLAFDTIITIKNLTFEFVMFLKKINYQFINDYLQVFNHRIVLNWSYDEKKKCIWLVDYDPETKEVEQTYIDLTIIN